MPSESGESGGVWRQGALHERRQSVHRAQQSPHGRVSKRALQRA